MDPSDKKPSVPDSPNTHKRIMARNRMRRYRLRKKQNQTRVQTGAMMFTLPPQSPLLFDGMMNAASLGAASAGFYQPQSIEGYEPPIMPPHSHINAPPPQMQPPSGTGAASASLPGVNPQQRGGAEHVPQQQQQQHQQLQLHQQHPQQHQPVNTRQMSHISSPHTSQGLIPALPIQNRAIDTEAMIAFQQACEGLAMGVSRPVNVNGVLQDVINVLPMRCDSNESLEFATRICRILNVHMA